MNRHAPEPGCPRTDAVLAIYLDGDTQPEALASLGAGGGSEAGSGSEAEAGSGFEFVCSEALRTHLLGCPVCQQQLQRARRLDATLAAGAWRAFAGDHEMATLRQRWFAAVAADAAEGPTDEAVQPHHTAAAEPRWLSSVAPSSIMPLAAVVVAAVMLAAVMLAAVMLHWLPLAPRDAAPSGARPEVAHAASAAPPSIASPSIAPAATNDWPMDILVASDAARRHAASHRDRAMLQRVPSMPELQQQCADERAPRPDRLLAARHLLTSCRSPSGEGDEAGEALVNALAGFGDRTASSRLLHLDLLDLARAEPKFVAHVQRRLQRLEARRTAALSAERRLSAELEGATHDLPDLALLTVAARLGLRAFDAAILRVLRRQPDLALPLAAALRSGIRDEGAAQLLLDCWQEMAARGNLGQDEFQAQYWFAGQAANVFTDLVVELRTSGSAPRRVHCLLALGFCPDDSALPVLLERIAKAPHLEAHAAAFALSRQPRRLLVPLLERAAQNEDGFLLRAALARAALPEAAVWTAALSLRAAEHSLLREGPFRDFPLVANWFRERLLGAGD